MNSSVKILIADDEERWRRLVGDFLRNEGYKTEMAFADLCLCMVSPTRGVIPSFRSFPLARHRTISVPVSTS